MSLPDLPRQDGFLCSLPVSGPVLHTAAVSIIEALSSWMPDILAPLCSPEPSTVRSAQWMLTVTLRNTFLTLHLSVPAPLATLHFLPYTWTAGVPGRARPSPSHQTAYGPCGRPRSPGHRRFQSASPAPAAGSLSPGACPQSPPRRWAPRSAY